MSVVFLNTALWHYLSLITGPRMLPEVKFGDRYGGDADMDVETSMRQMLVAHSDVPKGGQISIAGTPEGIRHLGEQLIDASESGRGVISLIMDMSERDAKFCGLNIAVIDNETHEIASKRALALGD